MYVIATIILSQEHYWDKKSGTFVRLLEKASRMAFEEANNELFNLGRLSTKGLVNPNCHYEIKKCRSVSTFFADYIY